MKYNWWWKIKFRWQKGFWPKEEHIRFLKWLDMRDKDLGLGLHWNITQVPWR